jgi:hypothetical protein
MEACGGVEVQLNLFLRRNCMELSCQLHDLAVLLPRKEGHIQYEAIWVTESVWMLLR